jgi:cytochrome c peroxidase
MRLIPIAVLLTFAACRVDPPIVPQTPSDVLAEKIPQGWPLPVYSFSVNTLSQEKFELGRALFYEPMLSRDNTISCSACHQQFAAFANADHVVSHGIDQKLGNRNSPALFNLNWHPWFMHDGGVNHIEVQPLAPIANPLEMDEDINKVLDKLRQSSTYRNLFTSAYGTDEVNSQKMLRAMAVFMGMMYSYNSKFDQYQRGEDNVTLTDSERKGYDLFVGKKCASCHVPPLFSDYMFRSNGLPPNRYVADSGRAHITRRPQDLYRFKTPSLRNIAKSGPYMHDGRFSTLAECLDHYARGVTNTTNLDPLLEYGIPLTSEEKQLLTAFLLTLTDYTFLSDKRFADPRLK